MTESGSAADSSERSAPARPNPAQYDILWVSSLSWGHPRPRQLLRRCSLRRRVFFVEAAHATDGPPRLDFHCPERGLVVATPYLPRGLEAEHREALLRGLLGELVRGHGLASFVLWHDSPRTFGACRGLAPRATVYDCHAAPGLGDHLAGRVDLVFVADPSGLETAAIPVHVFPGGVDIEHFARARGPLEEPPELAGVPRPRLGCLGSLDRRLDLDLLAGIADLRRDFHVVLLGDLDRSSLPRRPNIHDLGQRAYAELPAYLAGWDVALLPYARTAGPEAIDPARPLELLAAGKPVVATPLPDLINPFGVRGLVAIADQPEDFVVAVDCELRRCDRRRWLVQVDAFLGERSWERTWRAMEALIAAAVGVRRGGPT